MSMLRKHSEVQASKSNPLLYIVSDETPDRYGDVIRANGWKLQQYMKNSVALAHHDPNFVIGKWEGLHVTNGQLRAHLTLADAGISQRIDEIRMLVLAGLMPAASVGFIPVKSKPRANGGVEYLEQELCEISCVAIPANSNAVMLKAKAMGIRPSTIEKIFTQAPYHGSIAQRAAAARASLARSDEQLRKSREALRRIDALYPADPDEGRSVAEITRRETARLRKIEIGKQIDTRINLEIGVRLAIKNHCGEMSIDAAETFMREQLARIADENRAEQTLRDAENARRHRDEFKRPTEF